jgi:POT family proton-dependent oligopeptide transporter
MRAILVLYLTSKFWGMSDTQAYLTYGSYVAFVYMTPLIGGYVADRFLGHVTSVKYGCIFILIGHLLLSLDSSFFLGLGFVVVGTGFFKSAMNVNIGNLYSNNDLKDSAYTLFYMAVNTGSALATISIPLIAKYYGWHYGFVVAALGMSLGLLVLMFGQFKGFIAQNNINVSKLKHIVISTIGVILTFVFAYLISHPGNTGWLLYTLAGMALLYLAFKAVNGGKEYVLPIMAVFKISLIVMVFWIVFEQGATSMLLFIHRYVDLNVFGFTISAANVSVANNIFVIALSPLFAIAWSKYNFNIFNKMGLGLILAGFSMVIITIASYYAMQGSIVSLWWIILVYLFMTMGELSCSPTGLSAISKVAPTDIAAILFGLWGIKSSISNYLASYIASSTDIGRSDGTIAFVIKQANAYYDLYYALAIVSIVIGLIVILLSKYMYKLYKI